MKIRLNSFGKHLMVFSRLKRVNDRFFLFYRSYWCNSLENNKEKMKTKRKRKKRVFNVNIQCLIQTSMRPKKYPIRIISYRIGKTWLDNNRSHSFLDSSKSRKSFSVWCMFDFSSLLCSSLMLDFLYWSYKLKKQKHPIFSVRKTLEHYYSYTYSDVNDEVCHYFPWKDDYCYNRVRLDSAGNKDKSVDSDWAFCYFSVVPGIF